MKIMRSLAQPELIHVVLLDEEAKALRKDKNPQAKEFKKLLKQVLNAK